MRTDWTHHDLEAERFHKKARNTMVATQSVGPGARAVALVQAECQLLEAINALRETLACVREMQKAPGSF